jgi:hypothetical protein
VVCCISPVTCVSTLFNLGHAYPIKSAAALRRKSAEFLAFMQILTNTIRGSQPIAFNKSWMLLLTRFGVPRRRPEFG